MKNLVRLAQTFLVLLSMAVGLVRAESPALLSNVRDFGAKGDGAADDTAALQRAVDARRGGVFLPRGVYRITRPIVVDLDRLGTTSITGDGTARIVMAGPGPAIRFVGTHFKSADPPNFQPNVWERQRMPLVDGLEIVGAHAEAVGVEAVGTMQLTISRVLVREALHGIHLPKHNRNVIVANCHLYKNRGVGLYLDDLNLHQINVVGCHISYNAGGGIVVRTGNVRNLQISGCDIEMNMGPKDPPTANVLVDVADSAVGIGEVAITGCTIQHTFKAPDSANVRFLGVDRAGRRWGYLTVANNIISDTQINVDLQGVRGANIVGNVFGTGAQYDLRVRESSHVVVGPNTFDRNPNYRDEKYSNNGLLFRDCEDCTLSGLHVAGVRRARAGIVLENCRRMHLAGCTVLDCDNAGVLLENVTASRMSDCLLRNDIPSSGPWQPVVAIGGSDNKILP